MSKLMIPLTILIALTMAVPAQAILLGNHQLTIELLGTTEYFEFADFTEWEFPVQGLDWGYRLTDIDKDHNPIDTNYLPDDIHQNRNQIQLHLDGSLDIGLRFRSSIRPRLGVEGYLKYTPADLIITYNNQELSEATFTRYSGVTNPDDAEHLLNWVQGDFPTYHIVRFGMDLDYVFYRSSGNTMNSYVSVGGGIISYFRSGELFVPTDYDEEGIGGGTVIPSAPKNISEYLPNDSFPSANFGIGTLFYVHRYFGINASIRMSWTPFEVKSANFDKENHWIMGLSLGYTIRLG
jgi:hypothetical protein